jgi:hypothetical protein
MSLRAAEIARCGAWGRRFTRQGCGIHLVTRALLPDGACGMRQRPAGYRGAFPNEENRSSHLDRGQHLAPTSTPPADEPRRIRQYGGGSRYTPPQAARSRQRCRIDYEVAQAEKQRCILERIKSGVTGFGRLGG